MCGRYRLTAKERWLSEYFNLDPEDLEWAARWNIAPTQEVATVRYSSFGDERLPKGTRFASESLDADTGSGSASKADPRLDSRQPKRVFGLMRWGLIPYWAKDAAMGAPMINAMSETAAEKPAFKEPMRRRRCLIPADGFYEWRRGGGGKKQAFNIGMRNDELFAFAGLWDRWKNPEGKTIETCTVLTTAANALVADVHDRMPAILRPEDYDLWLDPGVTDPARVAELLRPYDARQMRKYPVSDFVNRAENEGPECGREVEEGEAQGKLW